MVNVVIFYDHLEHFTAIWYNLWPFGTVCGHLVYFLVCLEQEKSGNPSNNLD
jgi:cytosine/uracil/thiamine/allantoin permease